MKTPLKGWLVLLLLLGTTAYCVAEQITLTTYYPSPRGVYHELRTLGNVQIGSIDAPAGTVARLHVVGNGNAPAFQVDAGAAAPNALVVARDGNVGIGMIPDPNIKLDVTGRVHATEDICTNANGGVCLSHAGVADFAVFNADGIFTVPAGVTRIMVEVWGGGGGGGGGGSSADSGGGAGGGYGKDTFVVTPGANYAVTVGMRGNGGPTQSGGSVGGNGGTSSFGALISATGGQGGSEPRMKRLATGGTSAAPINITGGIGGANTDMSNGDGGSAGNGGAGGPGFTPLTNPVVAHGQAPGGGGAGGVGGQAGGNGGAGRVIVSW